MLQNINDVYLLANFLANSLYSGKISPSEFNLCVNIAQQQYQRKLIGLPELYTVDKREAPIQIQVTYVVSDAMRSFIKSADIQKTSNGFTLPADFVAMVENEYMYVELLNGQSVGTHTPIDFVTTTEWGERRQNYVTRPNYEYPIATYENGRIITEPSGIDIIKLRYYRYPVTPVWGFTMNANDQPIYNPNTSVQLEFPSNDWENITHILVGYWSTFIRDIQLKDIEQSRVIIGQ
jgi:hypothetical protein